MPQVQWIDETEAAKILELSEKRVRQFAGGKGLAGYIKTQREINPQTKRERTLYHAGDVERLKAQRLNRIKVATTRALAAMPISGEHAQGEISPPALPKRIQGYPGPWLRIPQLAEEWEVSEGAIYELIRGGELPARRFTCRDPWRIHRSDADEFRGIRQRTEGEISTLAHVVAN